MLALPKHQYSSRLLQFTFRENKIQILLSTVTMNKWRLLLLSVLSLLQSASADRNFVDGRDRSDTRLSIQGPYHIHQSSLAPDKLNYYEVRDADLTRARTIRPFKQREIHWRSPSVQNNDHRRSIDEETFRIYSQSDSREFGQRNNEHNEAIRVDVNRNRIAKQNEDRDYSENSRPSRRDKSKEKLVTRLHVAEALSLDDIALKKNGPNSRDRRVYNRRIEIRLIKSVHVKNGRDLDQSRFVRRELVQRTELGRHLVRQFESRNAFEESDRGNRNDKFSSRISLDNENTQETDASRSNMQRQQVRNYGAPHIKARSELHRKERATNEIRLTRNAHAEKVTKGIRHIRNVREEREINEIRLARNTREDRAINEIQVRNTRDERKNEIRHTRNTRQEKEKNEIRLTRNTLQERATNEITFTQNARGESATNEIRLTRNVPEVRATNEIRFTRNTREERAPNVIRYTRNAREERATIKNRHNMRNDHEERATNEIRLTRNALDQTAKNKIRITGNAREDRTTNKIRHIRNIRTERTNEVRLTRNAPEDRATNENGFTQNAREKKARSEIRLASNDPVERAANKIQLTRNAREERATNAIRVGVTREERATNKIRLTRNAREERVENEMRLTRNAREELPKNEIRHVRNVREERATNEIRLIRNTRDERTNEIGYTQNVREKKARNEIKLTRNDPVERATNDIRLNQHAREGRAINEIPVTRNAPEEKAPNKIRLARAREERAANEIRLARNAREEMASNEIRHTRNACEERATNEIRHIRNTRDERTNEIQLTRNTREERANEIQRSRNTREAISKNDIRNDRNIREERASDEIERSRNIQERLLNTRRALLARDRHVNRNTENSADIHKMTTSSGERVTDVRQDSRNIMQTRKIRRLSLFREKKRSTVQLLASPMLALNAEMDSNLVLKWQYLFFLLQGLYLCSLFMKMPNNYEKLKKTRTADWFATMDYLKID